MLDTTFLVDSERGAASASLIADDDVAMSAITAAELLAGVELATGPSRAGREAFVGAALRPIPIIAYDLVVARSHAGLLASVRPAGRRRGAHDLLIAATAKATGRVVLTADPAGFDDLPEVELLGHR